MTETVARVELIKDDKSPALNHDNDSISVVASPRRQSVNVKLQESDGECHQRPASGNGGKYRIIEAEETGKCDGKDGICRDTEGGGAGTASSDNIRRNERRPPDKFRGVATNSSDTAGMSGKGEDREQEKKIQQELRSWIRNMSEYRYERESSNKKGMRMRSSVPLRIGSKPLDTHTMFESGLGYLGDQDVKGRPHGQGKS